jgi:hypothetical protein
VDKGEDNNADGWRENGNYSKLFNRRIHYKTSRK